MSAATRATAPITTVTPLPQRESFRSLTSGWKIGWTMSRTTADDARIRSESTVDMMAGRTTTRNIPEKRAGKRALFITGRIVSWSASPGKRTRPAIQIVGNPGRTTTRNIPEKRAGKRALFITGRIVSWSASPGKRTRPAIQIVGNPDRVVPVRVCLERACHVLPGEQHAEEFSQDHTQGVEADGVPHPGEPEEQPGALARRDTFELKAMTQDGSFFSAT